MTLCDAYSEPALPSHVDWGLSCAMSRPLQRSRNLDAAGIAEVQSSAADGVAAVAGDVAQRDR